MSTPRTDPRPQQGAPRSRQQRPDRRDGQDTARDNGRSATATSRSSMFAIDAFTAGRQSAGTARPANHAAPSSSRPSGGRFTLADAPAARSGQTGDGAGRRRQRRGRPTGTVPASFTVPTAKPDRSRATSNDSVSVNNVSHNDVSVNDVSHNDVSHRNGAVSNRARTGSTQKDTSRNGSHRDDGTVSASEALFAATLEAVAMDTTFAELGVPSRFLAPLARLGAEKPFPIQAATLPATLAGRDVLGRGKTGSGKTIAFAVPLVARLAGGRTAPSRPRGLVLVPTRELALQVHRTIAPLAAAAGLRATTIFGGVGYGNQTSALRSGVDIVVACPGRLEDLIAQGACNLGDVEVTVLDEADHMADLGFLPGVRRLLTATRRGGQRMLFSATLDNGISLLVKDFLTDPEVHAVDDESSPIESMTHHVFLVDRADRSAVVHELAAGRGRRLFFARTKHGAKKWAQALSKSGISAVDLHGNLSQNARERNLAAFSSGAATVLVATDIAARGIHVDNIELVVHVDPPAEHKAYLHRSGRTARAGAGGTVVTLMLPEQRADVRDLMRKAGITATTTAVTPGSAALAAVIPR